MARKPSKNNVRAAVTTERRLEAFKLRQVGMNFQEIADTLGISKPGAWQLVDKAMTDYTEANKEGAGELRELTLLQLDALLSKWIPLSDCDDKAAGIVLKTLGERSKLMGLYAPQRTELTGKDSGPLLSMTANANVDLTNLSDEQLSALEVLMTAAAIKV